MKYIKIQLIYLRTFYTIIYLVLALFSFSTTAESYYIFTSIHPNVVNNTRPEQISIIIVDIKHMFTVMT